MVVIRIEWTWNRAISSAVDDSHRGATGLGRVLLPV
jgi:hypothetical protein